MITLSCDGIELGAKKKDNERLIAKLGRRKLQLKCKFCFVFQRSLADKFSVSCAFFRHEQRLSLRLPLSVLSEIIISWNKQFCTKNFISLRIIYITDITDLQNVLPLSLSLGTTP